jgi:hypothetical protein
VDPTPSTSESVNRFTVFADVDFAGNCSRLQRYWASVDFGISPLNASAGNWVASVENTLLGVPTNFSCKYRSVLTLAQPITPRFVGGLGYKFTYTVIDTANPALSTAIAPVRVNFNAPPYCKRSEDECITVSANSVKLAVDKVRFFFRS